MKNDKDDYKTALDYAKDTNFLEITCPEIVKLLEDYNQRHEDRKNLAVIEKAAREEKTNMPPSMEKVFKMNEGQRPSLKEFFGGKRKKLKGGAQGRPPVNVYKMVDELINLGRNMSNIEEGLLQNKYQEIMRNIKYATDDNLKKCFIEIHHVMFKPNSYNIIPINLHNVSLRPKLQDIEKEICKKIDCSILKSDPYSTHFGGKRKRKTRKCKKSDNIKSSNGL